MPMPAIDPSSIRRRLMHDMQFDTFLENGYAEIRCRGAYTLESYLATVSAALDFAAANDRDAVLVDVTAIGGAPRDLVERYEIGERVAKLQLGKPRLVGLYVVGKPPFISPSRFAETVALNRCAVGKVFLDRDEAISWILAR